MFLSQNSQLFEAAAAELAGNCNDMFDPIEFECTSNFLFDLESDRLLLSDPVATGATVALAREIFVRDNLIEARSFLIMFS